MKTEYYSNLLIKQYHNKPKAQGTIQALTTGVCMAYNKILNKLNSSFNIETATGAQLDIIGQIIGRSRIFEGIEFKNTETPNSLDDETYRTLLKMQIINNFSLKSIKSITKATFNFFGENIVFINNTNMTIDYILINKPTDNLIKVVAFNKSILPAPAGVEINYIIDIPTQKIFGFQDVNEQYPINFVGFSTTDTLIDGTFINNKNLI